MLHDLDWFTLLREVIAHGAAFAAGAVRPPCCDQVAAELVAGPFEPVEPVIGQVRQQTESFVIPLALLERRYPVLAGLCQQLVRQLHTHGLPQWAPNEVAVQRYQPDSIGITPHRDQRRYAQLVAIITVAGSAPFTLCHNRIGDAIRTWQAEAGSLVLLRGTGLAGEPDGRPMHMVGAPIGAPRTSIGIRMDTHASSSTSTGVPAPGSSG